MCMLCMDLWHVYAVHVRCEGNIREGTRQSNMRGEASSCERSCERRVVSACAVCARLVQGKIAKDDDERERGREPQGVDALVARRLCVDAAGRGAR